MIQVIGNAAVDTVIRLDRFPRPGETIVALGAADDLGGKGANQAIVAARCGAEARLIAAIGADALGERIRAALSAEGVAADGLSTSSQATDRCIITVDRQGENMIVSLLDASLAFDPVAETAAKGWIGPGDWVVMQGNLQASVTRACLALARSRGATTVLNPSPTYPPTDYDWRLVDLAVVNRSEAVELAGGDPFEAAMALRNKGAGAVGLTLGAEGSAFVSGGEMFRVRASEVAAIDTVGAGDVFCGTLVAARARGLGWREALNAASEAAALCVSRTGVLASFPSRVEMAHILKGAARRQGAEEH
ncbi:MAG: ribokinase [Hyphomicrobiales bacterium]|nr:ribokinase [Hyphomicrobiales bacterium]